MTLPNHKFIENSYNPWNVESFGEREREKERERERERYLIVFKRYPASPSVPTEFNITFHKV